jgi:hypothetical protein
MIGFIYKIFDNTNGSIYYGSTTQTISKRMTTHRSSYKAWVAGKRSGCKSFGILKNNDYSYSLVEQVECENKMELLQRERFWIENNECVNKCIPIRSQDERKEYHKEYHHHYQQQNRERLNEQRTENNRRNKERVSEEKKEYYQRKKAEKLKYQREYYQRKKAEKLNLIII